MLSPATRLLFRDELIGFAKSRVMIVLWVLLPGLATIGYFLLPSGADIEAGMGGEKMPMTFFMGLMLSSLAGTIAAVMLAVDVVSEKTRKVYELFIVRPINPGSILWAKFFAVFLCVTFACVLSLGIGLAVDSVRGIELPDGATVDTLKSLASLTGVIALSSAVGIFFGIMSRSILVAVILVLYVGQNLTFVPMLPTYFGILPDLFWLAMLLTAALAVGLLLLAVVLFRRGE